MTAFLAWFVEAVTGLAASVAGPWVRGLLRSILRRRDPIRLELHDGTPEEGAEIIALTDEARIALKRLQSTPGGIMYAAGPAADYDGEPPEGSFTLSRRGFLELEAKGLVVFHQQGRKLDLTHLGWTLNPDTGRVDKVG